MKLLITTQAIDRDDPILGFFHGWVLEFAKHFERIDIICLRKGTYELPPHVHVHSLGKEEGENRLKYTLRFYYLFAKIFFGVRVEYVFFHMGAIYNILAFPFFLIRKLFNTKFYWWKTHGKINHLKERLAFKFCDAVYTAGSKSFNIAHKKVHVVGHAVDTVLFSPHEHAVKDLHTCIMVGRIVPIKRIEIALSVMRKIKDIHPGMRLVVVGAPDTEDYFEELKTFTRENGLTNVEFVGSKTHSELPTYYQTANILLHPAHEAGFDKVVLEAMASGVIPLTSIPSFETILSPFGLYIEPNNEGKYIEQMQRIYCMNKEDRNNLSLKLRDVVVSNHSIGTLPKRIFGI